MAYSFARALIGWCSEGTRGRIRSHSSRDGGFLQASFASAISSRIHAGGGDTSSGNGGASATTFKFGSHDASISAWSAKSSQWDVNAHRSHQRSQ